MTAPAGGLRQTALILQEDIRKIDAGEVQATPEYRAFLAGAVKAWNRPAAAESGGLPVDHAAGDQADDSPSLGNKGLDGGRPENTRLADSRQPSFDGGRPASHEATEQTINGGRP